MKLQLLVLLLALLASDALLIGAAPLPLGKFSSRPPGRMTPPQRAPPGRPASAPASLAGSPVRTPPGSPDRSAATSSMPSLASSPERAPVSPTRNGYYNIGRLPRPKAKTVIGLGLGSAAVLSMPAWLPKVTPDKSTDDKSGEKQVAAAPP